MKVFSSLPLLVQGIVLSMTVLAVHPDGLHAKSSHQAEYNAYPHPAVKLNAPGDPRDMRIAHLKSQGTFAGYWPAYEMRYRSGTKTSWKDIDKYQYIGSIQAIQYDAKSNIVYTMRATAKDGAYIFASDYATQKLLGHSCDPTVKRPYNGLYHFGHQNIALFHPDDPKMIGPGEKPGSVYFFCGGYKLASYGGIEDKNLYRRLNLVTWDYRSPQTVGLRRSWLLFGSGYDNNNINPCLTPDGRFLIAKCHRLSDGVMVVGIWNVGKLLSIRDEHLDLSAVDRAGRPVFAERLFESPWKKKKISVQCLVTDGKYLYTLSSGTSGRALHHIKVMTLDGKMVFDRPISSEGEERFGLPANRYEGEVLVFLPVNGQPHLHLAVYYKSTGKSDGMNRVLMYDLDQPSSQILQHGQRDGGDRRS